MKRRSHGEKVSDPISHADRSGEGPFHPLSEHDLWGDWAPHYTTVTRFGRAGGTQWYNNCGPTAVTNLIVMARRKLLSAPPDPEGDLALYARIARYGARHLFYVNREKGLVHGTSDLLAGTYLRRMFRRAEGMHSSIRLRRASTPALLRALDDGALLYLILRNHPAYKNHHLVGYGYITLKSERTGRTKTYLKVSDGHAAAPRYLDLAGAHRWLHLYYEVRFRTEKPAL